MSKSNGQVPSFAPINRLEFLKIMDLFRPSMKLKAWAICSELLMRTRRRSGMIDGVHLERGQAMYGEIALAELLGTGRKTIRNVTNILKKARKGAIQTNRHGSILTWSDYNTLCGTSESEGPTEGPTRGQPGANQGPHKRGSKTYIDGLDEEPRTPEPDLGLPDTGKGSIENGETEDPKTALVEAGKRALVEKSPLCDKIRGMAKWFYDLDGHVAPVKPGLIADMENETRLLVESDIPKYLPDIPKDQHWALFKTLMLWIVEDSFWSTTVRAMGKPLRKDGSNGHPKWLNAHNRMKDGGNGGSNGGNGQRRTSVPIRPQHDHNEEVY